ncbi:hypothetical protein Pint_31043 [Pistacia integerrima]|uniref:Uncharacterized protein n=1 Tax=Pistacia integerrima TaxID=434235 RepID=A0ACC0XP87_9ROSI|nr:hypothetical protein Pint_31043 [Pistacia integerrima]
MMTRIYIIFIPQHNNLPSTHKSMEFVNPLQFLKDKTILVTGATGFLGKVFVEKILRIQPNVKKLYLLVRAADAKSAMKRILDEVEKDLFNVLRDKLGANFKSFVLEKVAAVVGDVSEVNLGVKDSKLMEEMYKEIDLVVNSAATTDFDERYDFTFNINTMGTLNIMSFAKNCIKINMVLHVSTGSGLIPEKPFYNGETLKCSCRLEITEEKKLIDEKLNQLQAQGAAKNELTSTMKELGIQRARFYGWPNTYAFTKAMGEMILGKYRGNLPLVIVRPTIITSTFAEPFPGWIEGLRTIDGPIAGYGKGKLTFLLANPKAICDMMPVDMVVNSMIMAMTANTRQSSQMIYQVGSSMRNPIKLTNVLKLISVFDKKYKDVCIGHGKKIKFAMRLVDLYKPYMFFKGIFDDTNSQKLRMEVGKSGLVDAFNFDPKSIDWEDYIINTHIVGLVKYVLKG